MYIYPHINDKKKWNWDENKTHPILEHMERLKLHPLTREEVLWIGSVVESLKTENILRVNEKQLLNESICEILYKDLLRHKSYVVKKKQVCPTKNPVIIQQLKAVDPNSRKAGKNPWKIAKK